MYKALTTFQHNGGLYRPGDEVPADARWGELLVKMGRVELAGEVQEKPAKKAKKTKKAKATKAAKKPNASNGYNRRDMAGETESK